MDNTELHSRLQRAELKNQALLQALQEKVTNLTTSYENQIADLRVELTIVGEQLRVANEEKESNEVLEGEAGEEPASEDDSSE